MFAFEEAASNVVFPVFHLKYMNFILLNFNFDPFIVVNISIY